MIFWDKFIATVLLLAAVGIGTGCNKSTTQPDQPGPPTSGTSTGTGSGDNGNPNDPGHHHHPLVASVPLTIYQDTSGACYTDNPWAGAKPGTDTVAWSSGDHSSAYFVEFYSTPLRNGSTPVYVVTVPPNAPSTAFPVVDYNNACQTSPSLSSCYFQYQIVKVANNPTSRGDICGPSPLTVGIHIKP